MMPTVACQIWTEIKPLLPAVIGAAMAWWIAVKVYLKQKQIDRDTSSASEVRKVHAEFLALFEEIRETWGNGGVHPRPQEEVDARRKLFGKQQLIYLFASPDVAAKAEALYNADEQDRTAQTLARRAEDPLTRKGTEELTKVRRNAAETTKKVHTAYHEYLSAVRKDHLLHLGKTKLDRAPKQPNSVSPGPTSPG
ncbi:hypothetical protein [Paracoccus sp. SY]|uniref:hypothetical protein n=1 Tax=Paracoccus sp. SY TaxID=1330255 RepID=UPI001304A151|nr:hypothetical protein [Paracoccus sp. SY]